MENQVQLESRVAFSKPGSLWRNRTFALMFTGNALSVFGSCFHSVALNLWVLQATGSAKLMSTIMITHMVISMLFGSIAGTVADRIDRKKLIWITDLIRSLLVFGIAVCISFTGTPFIIILILTALSAFAGLFHSPAFQASLTDIVGREKIQQATGALNIADNVSRISGLALGGMFVAAFGGVGAIVFDAVTFMLCSILVLLAGTFPQTIRKAEDKKSFQEDLMTGFKHIWKNPFARSVVILSPTLIMFFISSLMLIQVMAVKVWMATPAEFGMIEACIPLGYMIGAGMIMVFDNKLKHRGWFIVGSMLLIAPLFMVLSVTSSTVLAIPQIFIVGFMFSFCTLLVNIIIRMKVDSELQGRMFGILGSLTSVAPPVGLAISSFFADIYGSSIVLLTNGFGLLLAGLMVLIFLKSVRTYD